MFRYLGFSWPHDDPCARDAVEALELQLAADHSSWHCVFRALGLCIFTRAALADFGAAYEIDGGSGVVLGTLFQRTEARSTPGKTAVLLGLRESQLIKATGGRYLLEAYWGRYVAFLFEAREQMRILRDPTGCLPCYQAQWNGVRTFFSAIEDYKRLLPCKFSINWQHVALRLVAGYVKTSDTGLSEIDEVQPGECLEIRGRHTQRTLYWDPFRYMESVTPITNPQRAADQLRLTTKQCVHTWAAQYPHILQRLSGGLDSSIVLSCMRDAPSRPRVVCLNYHSPGPNTDERSFARISAEHSGYPLIERRREPNVDLNAMLKYAANRVDPSAQLHFYAVVQAEMEIASEVGAHAVFGGETGDALFYFGPALPVVADYVRDHGLRPSTFRVALDVADMTHLSVWSVFLKALRNGLFSPTWIPHALSASTVRLVDRDLVQQVCQRSVEHPWFRSIDNVPLGKLWHVLLVGGPREPYHPKAECLDLDMVEPLISQPLFELCLRIPTYVLLNSGWNRALARQAFATELAPQIVSRRTKGGHDGYARELLGSHRASVRELLLDGVLVREGIISAAAVEDAFSEGNMNSAPLTAEILGALSTEAWARAWLI